MRRIIASALLLLAVLALLAGCGKTVTADEYGVTGYEYNYYTGVTGYEYGPNGVTYYEYGPGTYSAVPFHR